MKKALLFSLLTLFPLFLFSAENSSTALTSKSSLLQQFFSVDLHINRSTKHLNVGIQDALTILNNYDQDLTVSALVIHGRTELVPGVRIGSSIDKKAPISVARAIAHLKNLQSYKK